MKIISSKTENLVYGLAQKQIFINIKQYCYIKTRPVRRYIKPFLTVGDDVPDEQNATGFSRSTSLINLRFHHLHQPSPASIHQTISPLGPEILGTSG